MTAERKQILVVDDELGSRESLKAILYKIYDVVTAESAEQAGKILEGQHVDLILLDIMMPQKDGITFLKELSESHSDIPVIMVSAYSSPRFVFQSLRLGAADYLNKPFDVSEVRFVVERCLQGKPRQHPLPPVEGDTTGDVTLKKPDFRVGNP